MNDENRVGFPIQTMREGNKITKICVEDYYKMINRILRAEQRSAEKWNEFMDNIEVDVENEDGENFNGCLIVGTGVSQPNIKDAFDEEVGNNIAFMKAKLNANMKKRNLLMRLFKIALITPKAISDELEYIENLIGYDLLHLRQYNPEYLSNLDDFGYEIQEETAKSGSED